MNYLKEIEYGGDKIQSMIDRWSEETKCEETTITNCDTLKRVYSQSSTCKNVVEKIRKEMIEPYRKKINQINDSAKVLLNNLDNLREISTKKVEKILNEVEESKGFVIDLVCLYSSI